MATASPFRTLVEVGNPAEAELIKGLLEGAGIKCFIPDANLGLIYGGALGFKIQVPAADWRQAKTLLETVACHPLPGEEKEE
ncbi:MAG: DUF2007 domain-containing protein [Firmicutes bacterium]|nr:DUF2007 domain-containing protein [Bacillota bacterium]